MMRVRGPLLAATALLLFAPIALLLFAGIWMPALAAAPTNEAGLSEGEIVRIQSGQIGDGWHAGTLRTGASGCRMIFLGGATATRHESLTLAALERLQSARPVRWTEVALPALIEQEPRGCREPSAD
jgi:hypothetical protein